MRAFAQPAEVAGQRLDDLLPVAAHAVDVDLRRLEGDADVGGVAGVGDELGGVQHGLGRNAADVQAGAARPLAGIDERDLHALVGRQERRRIAAGTGAEDDELCVDNVCHIHSSQFLVRGDLSTVREENKPRQSEELVHAAYCSLAAAHLIN